MKKKINIALILVVLGLWGTVGYKTINQYFFSKEVLTGAVPSNSNLLSNLVHKDTFLLENVARDPFLNKQSHTGFVPKKYYPKVSIVKPTKPVIKPKVIINWPSITYHGYIKSKDKNAELVLVKINSKLYKLRKKDQVEGVTLQKVYTDSIELDFNKEKKVIKLN
ncbi:hypothetical protein [Flavobacterium sp. GT3R68]|uniref:hypothetical protein n=1 Tax=Flavobacterium sp. GT3R68 TaxID=2594437 RepID=UPI000F85CF8A|nr:hypothetical protein [Flavobacterium sp. GT3R68]RTY91798.1 hypothetical protein EKL32_18205 [Flavobacterium sp. GSN2]TRW90138.1 hypothetical protein FNW07_11815 [Flavobacterium sp. GT3R68]